MTWQPMETAPKDGSVILVTDGENYGLARWVESSYESWIFIDDDTQKREPVDSSEFIYSNFDEGGYLYGPTHWMPLPELPK